MSLHERCGAASVSSSQKCERLCYDDFTPEVAPFVVISFDCACLACLEVVLGSFCGQIPVAPRNWTLHYNWIPIHLAACLNSV